MKIKNFFLLLTMSSTISMVHAQARIDADVQRMIAEPPVKASMQAGLLQRSAQMTAIIFLNTPQSKQAFIQSMARYTDVTITSLSNMPMLVIKFPKNKAILQAIAQHPAVMQISSLQPGHEEMDEDSKAILLTPSAQYPEINNWWQHGFTGAHSVVGILDSGVDTYHPNLSHTTIITRQEPGSDYEAYMNGVHTPHATGIACIYAGSGNASFPNDHGLAPGITTIINALANEEEEHGEDLKDMMLVINSLDWMLHRASKQPNIINYSIYNGDFHCPACSEWSGLAKIFDYVVNHDHIFIAKSAGNKGDIAPSDQAPYATTLTIPGDNYNAMTVANMNITTSADRTQHTIYPSSSRGPTVSGRKKPDISAPGYGTRTCAPDPKIYGFTYKASMDYRDGFRLMGGTSSAAPHVGAAAALLYDAGITAPMAQKALLINSANAYTHDASKVCDPTHPNCGDQQVMGSEWNRIYGWGYLNMQQAFEQRDYLIQDTLTLDANEKIYEAQLPVGAKLTLVHERRVGYNQTDPWRLSHLSLEIIDQETGRVIAQDDSAQDTVHQVANCQRQVGGIQCSENTQPIHAIIKIRLHSPQIDGADSEPFCVASSVPLR